MSLFLSLYILDSNTTFAPTDIDNDQHAIIQFSIIAPPESSSFIDEWSHYKAWLRVHCPPSPPLPPSPTPCLKSQVDYTSLLLDHNSVTKHPNSMMSDPYELMFIGPRSPSPCNPPPPPPRYISRWFHFTTSINHHSVTKHPNSLMSDPYVFCTLAPVPFATLPHPPPFPPVFKSLTFTASYYTVNSA